MQRERNQNTLTTPSNLEAATAASDLRHFELQPDNPQRLASLCGLANDNLRQIEDRLDIRVNNRGNRFSLAGDGGSVAAAEDIIKRLYRETKGGKDLLPDTVNLYLQQSEVETLSEHDGAQLHEHKLYVLHTPKSVVKPRGPNQRAYVHSVLTHDINFGVGPAGTGKTFLAVACAVQALQKDQVKRIILVRPAVEAGEKLGFLPGDLSQKVDPYLRPLYDALYEMLGLEKVDRLIERNVIEVAPLAYMRGRTLSNAFIILDESQNTTKEQMKMFLTRIGFDSLAVITGDSTQVDLPIPKHSGLLEARKILKNIDGIKFCSFAKEDVVRHPLVQKIIEAYENRK